jgi:hypothetical protein
LARRKGRPGDPRPVAVITDHVAHAYEYLARLAVIAARHADGHREEIEAALG